MPDNQRRRGTGMIFVNASENVLLMLRDNRQDIPFPNCWDIPGGGVEHDETPQQCIQREMLEELELVLDDPRLFDVYERYDRREYMFWQQREFDIEAVPLHEGQRLRWFSEEDIARLPDEQIAFSFKPILLDFFRIRPWQP